MWTPEVYILILPAFGIISHIISTYSGRPVFGQIWPILEESKETNNMRESKEIKRLVKYSSMRRKAARVRSLTDDNYNLQITKARTEGYKLKTVSNQLSMLVGISEAIRLLTKNCNKRGRRFYSTHSEDRDIRWNQWLAGLIDGDGCFLLSKKGYASLEIVMENRDKDCLYQIKQRFGGSVKEGSGGRWLRYRLHHKKGLLGLIEAVNGDIRNPVRLIQLSKICDKYSIELRQAKSLEYSNGWLSGLIDSDGSVIMNTQSSQLKITVSQKNKLLLDLLVEIYGGAVYVERKTESFKWVVYKKEEIKNLVNYLNMCQLRSEKGNRILLINRYNELRQLKAHLATEESVMGKAWIELKKKWDNYNS